MLYILCHVPPDPLKLVCALARYCISDPSYYYLSFTFDIYLLIYLDFTCEVIQYFSFFGKQYDGLLGHSCSGKWQYFLPFKG